MEQINIKLETRWQMLMDAFGFDENTIAFSHLTKRYEEKHRAYHNLEHVKDCLFQLDNYAGLVKEKHLIEMAIWFHDIIYNPYRKDNELKSAEAASHFLSGQNTDAQDIQKVYDLILSTLHVEEPKNDSEALIMDIDITILGSEESRYESYCVKIRKEYRWIPGMIYRRKRKEILQRFLKRERLYFTDYFYSMLEEKARLNISAEISGLS